MNSKTLKCLIVSFHLYLLVDQLVKDRPLMRSFNEAQLHWSSFETYSSREQLRAAVKDPPDDLILTSVRSACWKVFLFFETFDRSQWPLKLRTSREVYTSAHSQVLHALEHQDELDDPLSEDYDSAWNNLRKDELLREEIYQDVDRCMAENLYFREPTTQKTLTDVLIVWSKLNPDTSYRQGMHEILGTILWVVYVDAIDPSTCKGQQSKDSNSLIHQIFDTDYIAHDSFTLFSIIMKYAKASYQRDSDSMASSQARASHHGQSAIIKRSENIINHMLVKADPELALHFKTIDIIPQVFLMRWIRLLFGREFLFDQTLHIWDRIFAEDPMGGCVDFICLAMLLRVRWQLLECDNSSALGLLLHYPDCAAAHPPSTLVDDALNLRRDLNFEAGSRIVALRTGRIPSRPSRSSTPSTPRRAFSPLSNAGKFVEQGGLENLLHDAAREVYSRGERWGVNQAVRDAVQEVRKNVQSHSQSLSQNSARLPRSSSTSVPSEELLARVTTLNERNKSLSKMLESAVDELWKQQKAISGENPDRGNDTEAFTMAIAKVQLVQVYLEDPSLTLPANEAAGSILKGQKSDGLRDADQIEGSQMHPEQAPATPPKQHNQTVMEGTEESNNLSNADSEVVVSSPSPSVTSSKASSRPPLNQSSFSWILGQNHAESGSARKTFLNNTSPFSMPIEQQSGSKKSATRSSAAYLFGDTDEEGDMERPAMVARHSGRNSKVKERGKRPEEKEENPEEAFRLGTFKGR